MREAGQSVDLPDYCASIDACLTLPIPEHRFWHIATSTAMHGDRHSAVLRSETETIEYGGASKSLPVAMLRAWWQMQPE
jgi:hypothetical protein